VLLCFSQPCSAILFKLGKRSLKGKDTWLTVQALQVRESGSPLPGCDAAPPILLPVLEPLI